MKHLKLTTLVLLTLTISALVSCKKNTGTEQIPVEQKTWNQLEEYEKIIFFDKREFTLGASTDFKNDVPVSPADCITDNTFFVDNGRAIIFYGTLECTPVDQTFKNTSRFSQTFAYSANKLTIGNLYRDNGITGNTVYDLVKLDEQNKSITISYTYNGDVYKRTYFYSDKKTSTPSKYVRP